MYMYIVLYMYVIFVQTLSNAHQRIGQALELYERMRSSKLRPSYVAMQCLMQELLRWGDLVGAESIRK